MTESSHLGHILKMALKVADDLKAGKEGIMKMLIIRQRVYWAGLRTLAADRLHSTDFAG